MLYSKKFLLFIFTFGFAITVNSQEVAEVKKFRDSLDNAFDMSHFLMNLHGVLPIVMPITEPALDYGAAVAGLYFLSSKNKEGDRKKPDIIGVAGGYTGNDSWFVGSGYFGFWKNDMIRYRGVLGYGDINLKYYGLGDRILSRRPLSYNIKSVFFLQQAVFRINNSNFFIGGKYQYSQTKTSLFENIEFGNLDLISSGVSLITEFENYNNIFSPSKGTRVHLSFEQNLEFLGSDISFSKLNFFVNFYFGGSELWTPALRIESLFSSESTPFYAKPYVGLRGVPGFRYQGNLTLLTETEHEFSLNKRWSLIGFAGIGAAFDSLDTMNSEEAVWNVGTGFRYLIARQMGLKMGLDVARGPEEFGVYITFGSSWLK